LEFVGRPSVVAVAEGDEPPTGGADRIIAGSSRTRIAVETQKFDAAVLPAIRFDYLCGIVSGTVIGDYQFPVSVGLGLNRGDGFADETGTIITGSDD
jgi:hypothetical protein